MKSSFIKPLVEIFPQPPTPEKLYKKKSRTMFYRTYILKGVQRFKFYELKEELVKIFNHSGLIIENC
jgi:hypothetical protein